MKRKETVLLQKWFTSLKGKVSNISPEILSYLELFSLQSERDF